MSKNILEADFIVEMNKVTALMASKGWHERNAGNISLLLDLAQVEGYLDTKVVKKVIPLKFAVPDLAGKLFLVTGTGKYFKNMEYYPERDLGIVRIADCGKVAELLWGFSDGGSFTSEFATHLKCHAVRLKVNPLNRVIMHSHTTNLAAMSYVHALNDKDFTLSLWQSCIEAILVFPEGIAVLPWMLCGTTDIGDASAEKMQTFRLVLWAMHGVFGCGNNLDDAFGLIETAEKSAEIFMKIFDKKQVNSTSIAQMKALADFWSVAVNKDIIDISCDR